MENRGQIESLVLSSLLQDMSLIADFPLSNKDFTFDRTKFFFGLIKELSTKYKELDEVTVLSYVGASPTLRDTYLANGGWESIKKIKELGNVKNYEKYIDDLEKSNLINRLKLKGFNIDQEIEIDNVKVKPIELFPSMNASQVHDFYEMLLADVGVNSLGDDMVLEDLYYTDEEIYKIDNQIEDNSKQFAVTLRWNDDDGKERYLQSFKVLNSLINGISHSNGVHVFAGHSGVGKTTITINIIMGLIEDGAKVLITSNEQQSKYFKEMLISIIARNVFKSYTITRKKIARGDFTPEEREIFIKANEFAKEKYKDKLKFIAMNEFKVDKIKKIAKKLCLSEGYDTLVLDTFKPEDASGTNTVGKMSENARQLDSFGKQMKMRIILPAQCATYSEGKTSYMTSAVLSHSKQIKEVAHTILLARKIIPEELDPKKEKYFLKPYKWQENKDTGKAEKVELEIIDSGTSEGRLKKFSHNCIDIQKHYILVFLDKNRAGKDQVVLLLEMDGETGMVSERATVANVYKGQLTY